MRKQVSLELDNQESTIPIIFLVASGLPFNMLIGCDVLRRYSAVINLQKGVVLLTSEQGTWSANIINCMSTPTALSQDPGLKSYYCQRREPSITMAEEEEHKALWKQKLEEIITFQRERPLQEISEQQSKKLMAIYNDYQHVFSNTPGKVKGYQLSLIHIYIGPSPHRLTQAMISAMEDTSHKEDTL